MAWPGLAAWRPSSIMETGRRSITAARRHEDLNYFVSQRLLDRNLRVGDAFWQAMKQYLVNGNTDFSGVDYDLYGDPTMSYWGNPDQQSTLASWPMLRNNAFGQGLRRPGRAGCSETALELFGGCTFWRHPGSLARRNQRWRSGGGRRQPCGRALEWQRFTSSWLLDAPAFGTPAIAADGSIYVVDVNGKLYDFNYGNLFFCFGGSCKGVGITSPWRSRRWTINLGSAPLTSPIIGSDGMIAAARLGGNFFGIIYSNVDMIRPDGVLFREEPILGNAIGALAISADQKVYARPPPGRW